MGNALGGEMMDNQENQLTLLRWELGMKLSTETEKEYQAATARLAKELMRDYTLEQLATITAQHVIYLDDLTNTNDSIKRAASTAAELVEVKNEQLQNAALENEVLVNDTASLVRTALNEHSTYKARKGADGKHNKPGASRDLKRKIQAIWATGKYSSRDICAEKEWSGLSYGSFCAARKALRNTPDPT